MRMLTVGSKEDTDFIYVGWHVKQSDQGIQVSQDNYIKKVDNPDMDKDRLRDVEEVLNEEEQSAFYLSDQKQLINSRIKPNNLFSKWLLNMCVFITSMDFVNSEKSAGKSM